jgi:hypothetical protein
VLQELISFGFILNYFQVISEEACDADGIFCSFWASAVFRFRASCQSSDQHSTHLIRAQYYWRVCLSLLESCWQRNEICFVAAYAFYVTCNFSYFSFHLY